MKTGLILEGGAMRGMFTAGVIDVMMENGIEPDGAVGVSADAAFGCNYKSRQIGRAIRYNMRFCKDRRYDGMYSLLTSGNLYNTDFCYAGEEVAAWERYIDELQQEEQWKELMAMRTGLKQQFYSLYPRIVESFKRHIRLLGNEGQILSSSEAKRYFCFYLDPGSVTFKRLWEELQKPVDKGKFKHEDYNPTTGKRSYCGIPIPHHAPPRPNEQAVWNGEKWIF